MIKYIAIGICLVLYSTEITAQLNWIQQFIDKNDANVTRVRTPEERDKRWKEFAVLDFIGLVEQYPGYTAEEYNVETKDGYILKLHRISGSPFSPKASGKPVVYMAHGLLCSSDFNVVLGPEHALAFQLADAGYDIWIGNFRGNTYSKRHVKYSSATSNYKFWDFSMDELSLIDLPLFIDTVLAKTNQKKLTYIGFSMGTTTGYMLLSSKPEYNDKMKIVISIAPVAIFTPPFSPLVNALLTFGPTIKTVASNRQIYQILPQSKLLQIVGKDICVTNVGKAFCKDILRPLTNVQFLNMTALPTVFAYTPAGTSLNVIYHYYQLMTSGKFQHYDFGTSINKNKYGASNPPEYDLTKISSPQAIFYSGHDVYANERDTKALKTRLQNVVAFERSSDDFNHLDFFWHRDAKEFIYNKIMKVVAQYL